MWLGARLLPQMGQGRGVSVMCDTLGMGRVWRQVCDLAHPNAPARPAFQLGQMLGRDDPFERGMNGKLTRAGAIQSFGAPEQPPPDQLGTAPGRQLEQ